MPRCLPHVIPSNHGWVPIKCKRGDLQDDSHSLLDSSAFIVQQLQDRSEDLEVESKYLGDEEYQDSSQSNKPLHTFRIVYNGNVIAKALTLSDIQADLHYITSKYVMFCAQSQSSALSEEDTDEEFTAHSEGETDEGEDHILEHSLSSFSMEDYMTGEDYNEFCETSTSTEEELLLLPKEDTLGFREEDGGAQRGGSGEHVPAYNSYFHHSFTLPPSSQQDVGSTSPRPPQQPKQQAPTVIGRVRVAPNFIFFLEREYQTLHVGKQHSFFSFKPFEEQKQYILKNLEYLRLLDSEDRTILHYAADAGLHNLASFILQLSNKSKQSGKGNIVDINARDCRGWTPLHVSLHNRYLGLAEMFIQAGADVNSLTNSHLTPLLSLCSFSDADTAAHLKLIQLLLDNGADITAKTIHLETAIHRASWRCGPEIILFLIDNGCDCFCLTKLKENALHYAARSGRSDVVSLLISRGVDSKQKGECGYPIDVTESASIREILERYMDFPAQPVVAPQPTEHDATNSEILVSPIIPRSLSFDSDVSLASSNSTTETSTLLVPDENSLEKESRAEDARRSSELEKIILLSAPTPDGIYKYALHRACQKGELEIVKELIKLRVCNIPPYM